MAKSDIKLSEEHKKKISDTLKGKHNSPNTQFKKGQKPWMTGKKHSEATRKKMRLAHIGKKRPKEVIEKMRLRIGRLSGNWKGGVTSINMRVRKSLEYKLWREAVFKRDNCICIWCGQRGGKLNADHIKPFALFPELRFAIDNGRTLCEDCHRTTDTYGNKKRDKYGRFA